MLAEFMATKLLPTANPVPLQVTGKTHMHELAYSLMGQNACCHTGNKTYTNGISCVFAGDRQNAHA
jgi:hypothetical protein